MRRMNVFLWTLLCVFSIAVFAMPAQAAVRKIGTCVGCTYTTISAAVADSVGGDRIEVYAGAYNESVDLNTMNTKGSITLVAIGTVTINPASGEPGITYDKADAGNTDFPGNISIQGFDVTSDSNAIELIGVAGDVTIFDCTADNAIGIGIWAQEVTGNVTMNNCAANNAIGIGIWVNAITGDVTLTKSISNDVVGIGIWLLDITGDVKLEDCTTNNFQGIGTWLLAITGDVTLMRCTADNGTENSHGFWLQTVNGNTIVQQCNANNNYVGIWLYELSPEKTHIVRCSNMSGNSECGLSLTDGNFNVEAVNNWWGDSSGPTHTGNPGGSGDAICEEDEVGSEYTGTVMFDPWLDAPLEFSALCRIVPVPTFNKWGLIVLAMSMAGAAIWTGSRRRKTV